MDYRHADGTPCTHGRISRDGLTLDSTRCPGLAWRIHRKNDERNLRGQVVFSFSNLRTAYGLPQAPKLASGGVVQRGKAHDDDSVPALVGFGEVVIPAGTIGADRFKPGAITVKAFADAIQETTDQIRAAYGLVEDVNKIMTGLAEIDAAITPPQE